MSDILPFRGNRYYFTCREIYFSKCPPTGVGEGIANMNSEIKLITDYRNRKKGERKHGSKIRGNV